MSVDDAVVAVQLVEASMQNAAMLGTGLASVLHSRPATDPEAECASATALKTSRPANPHHSRG